MSETEEEYMPRCPHCNDDVGQLNAFVLEENKYTVEVVEYIKGKPALDYGTSRVIELTAVKTDFACQNCEEIIFTVRGGDSDPQVVIDFLRGARMTWVQDALLLGVDEVLETLNKQDKPEGSYYAEGFPRQYHNAGRAGGTIGIYFVDPTSTEKGMDPVET